MPQNTAKVVLHILASRFVFFSLVRFPNYVFFLQMKVGEIVKNAENPKTRNRKVHVSFCPFLSILPVSDVVRKGLSRVVSQPLTTPYTLSHTYTHG